MNQMTIPEGYRQDRLGRFVPIETIKEIDLIRDSLVNDLVEKSKAAHQALKQLKDHLFTEIHAFVELSASEYGTKVGGPKGNVQLLSFDGKHKILLSIQESITFDERLLAAKTLIDECFREWTADSRPEIRALIDNAFAVDKQGNINTGRVLGLRKLDIKDEKWQRAMQAIADAITVRGSKSYVRVYERVGNTDQYQPISLDIAVV